MKKGVLQNIIIGFLLVGAVFFTLRLWFVTQGATSAFTDQSFKRFFQSVAGGNAQPVFQNDENPLPNLLLPQDILLHAPEGTKCFYSGSASAAAYDAVEDYFLPAFAQSGSFRPIHSDWSAVLAENATGILLDYGALIPYQCFSYLAGQSDFDKLSALSVRYLYLTVQNEKITVFLEDASGGALYRAAFTLPQESPPFAQTWLKLYNTTVELYPTQLLMDFRREHPALYDDTEKLHPLLKCGLPPAVSPITFHNPLYNGEPAGFNPQPLHNILTIFGFNPSNISRYPESDRSIVYVENFSTIRISTAGELEYSTEAADKGISVEKLLPPAAQRSAADMIAAACALVSRFDQNVAGGAAQLLLKTAYFQEDTKTFVVEFDYALGGLRIPLEKGYSASVELNSGYISKADIFFISYAQVPDASAAVTRFETALQILLSAPHEGLCALVPLYRPADNDAALLLPTWQGITRP